MDSLFKNIKNLKIYDSSMYHFEDISIKYKEYLDKLISLTPTKLKNFIQTLRNREIINNQETELEESFLIELYRLSQRGDSIEMTMKHFQNGAISKSDLKKIHRMVIKGSSDDLSKNYDYRSDNNKWVGSYKMDGTPKIDYFPPDFNEIDELVEETLSYLNEKNGNIENVFLKPLIVHALIAYLQPFGNGNTRLARVLQHCKICELTNIKYGTDFKYPTFYLSKNYLLTRYDYRQHIKKISIEKSDNSWNEWFKYNLNMIDEQLFYLSTQLQKYR